MKYLIAGSSGLIGTAYVKFLIDQGQQVFKLVRRSPVSENEVEWHPETGQLDPRHIEGFDVLVNLAGENVSSGRWTEAKKKRLYDSRLQPTRLLAATIAQLQHPPKLWMNASAIGYYGNRADQLLTESSQVGQGFLADLCVQWEEAARLPADINTRIVFLRTGVVLAKQGGVLAKLLPLFKLCLGGKIGSGLQYISWILIDDYLQALQFLVDNQQLVGAVNLTAPNPVTNSTFTEVLGKVLHRPTWFPLPQKVAQLLIGQMADELLLSSQRVLPENLQKAGFQFKYPYLEPALYQAV